MMITVFGQPIPLEEFCRPVPPEIGSGPVLERTHREAVHALQLLEFSVRLMRGVLQDTPRQDMIFDECDASTFKALQAATAAVTKFRETRDCQGEC